MCLGTERQCRQCSTPSLNRRKATAGSTFAEPAADSGYFLRCAMCTHTASSRMSPTLPPVRPTLARSLIRVHDGIDLPHRRVSLLFLALQRERGRLRALLFGSGDRTGQRILGARPLESSLPFHLELDAIAVDLQFAQWGRGTA